MQSTAISENASDSTPLNMWVGSCLSDPHLFQIYYTLGDFISVVDSITTVDG